MWVMFLVMNWHGGMGSAVPAIAITQEFTSSQTCNSAVKVAKASKKVYDAWCVKK